MLSIRMNEPRRYWLPCDDFMKDFIPLFLRSIPGLLMMLLLISCWFIHNYFFQRWRGVKFSKWNCKYPISLPAAPGLSVYNPVKEASTGVIWRIWHWPGHTGAAPTVSTSAVSSSHLSISVSLSVYSLKSYLWISCVSAGLRVLSLLIPFGLCHFIW